MKKQRRMAATDLRVHLGAALRTLDEGDIVIEKGGVPVAVLSRYPGQPRDAEREERYQRAVGRRGDPAAWPAAVQAMNEGWAGIDADELIRNIYRWREEGTTDRWYSLDDADGGPDDDTPAG